MPRITGLDPANPCFNEGHNLTGLARGDAEFVDIIHSNPGALGKRDSLGDADFYPNGYVNNFFQLKNSLAVISLFFIFFFFFVKNTIHMDAREE